MRRIGFAATEEAHSESAHSGRSARKPMRVKNEKQVWNIRFIGLVASLFGRVCQNLSQAADVLTHVPQLVKLCCHSQKGFAADYFWKITQLCKIIYHLTCTKLIT